MQSMTAPSRLQAVLLTELCSCLACKALVRCPPKSVSTAQRIAKVRPGTLWTLSGSERADVADLLAMAGLERPGHEDVPRLRSGRELRPGPHWCGEGARP